MMVQKSADAWCYSIDHTICLEVNVIRIGTLTAKTGQR